MAESTQKTVCPPSYVEGTAGLARHLGISRWTVSRVLNGHEGIREETRQRVLEAVEDLGFEPSRLARGLRGLPTGLVGVSFQHFEATVLTQKSQMLQEELGKAGCRGIFEMPCEDPVIEAAVVRHFLSIQVDGIVLIGSILPVDAPVLEEVRSRGVPIVAVDSRHPLKVARVTLDRGRGMELKLRHLHELGHRKIGVLGFGSDDNYGSVRLRGLRKTAQELGMNDRESLVRLDEEGFFHQEYDYGAALVHRILEMGSGGPTALLCLNDRLAIGALRTLQNAGKRIPEDYSVIGFDNLPESAWSCPALTTVDQNIRKLMEMAKKTLWGNAGAKPPHYKVEPLLVIRGSTGRPRQ